MFKFKEMKQKDIKPLKEKIWLQNNKKCPILDVEIPLDKMVLDHAHKKKEEDYSENKGVIRTALEFRINAFFGKIENSFKRYGLDKDYDLAYILRKGADYFDEGAYVDEEGYHYIHPNEIPKPRKLSKRNYNKCKKLYNEEEFIPKRKNQKKKPFPEYPKSAKPTKELIELFERFGIELFN
jgi:hypothetical protein